MKITPAFGPMSGKLGGVVASRNRGGAYFRAKSIPTNPNSARQQNVRATFAASVNYWANVMTQAERDAWNTYALNTPYTDTLGQTINMTGQNAFIASRVARVNAGLAAVTAAPIIFDHGNPVTAYLGDGTPDKIAITAGDLVDSVEVTGGASDDGDIIFQFGPPINGSRKFFKGPYQFAYSLAIGTGVATIADTETVSSFVQADPLVVGQFRPMRCTIAYDDGRVSGAFEKIMEVVAGA